MKEIIFFFNLWETRNSNGDEKKQEAATISIQQRLETCLLLCAYEMYLLACLFCFLSLVYLLHFVIFPNKLNWTDEIVTKAT